jgi:hypothetical protein
MKGGSGRWVEGTKATDGGHPCEEEETKGKVKRRPSYEAGVCICIVNLRFT